MPELPRAVSDGIIMDWQNGEFTISDDPNRLEIDVIHKYLSEESYWARERTREQTERAIKNSLPFGLYKGKNLIGFARKSEAKRS